HGAQFSLHAAAPQGGTETAARGHRRACRTRGDRPRGEPPPVSGQAHHRPQDSPQGHPDRALRPHHGRQAPRRTLRLPHPDERV
ncbi:uncharacterized protein METZ01_LOCUS99802, partial [marine metagenome]